MVDLTKKKTLGEYETGALADGDTVVTRRSTNAVGEKVFLGDIVAGTAASIAAGTSTALKMYSDKELKESLSTGAIPVGTAAEIETGTDTTAKLYAPDQLNSAINGIVPDGTEAQIIAGTDTTERKYTPADINGAVKDIAVAQYAGRTAMKAATGLTAGDVVYLSEGGRSGPFEYLVGDYSAEVAADTLEGVYVKLDAVAATVGVLKRRLNGYVTPEMFGYTTGDAGPYLRAALASGHNVTDTKDVIYEVTTTANPSDPDGQRYAAQITTDGQEFVSGGGVWRQGFTDAVFIETVASDCVVKIKMDDPSGNSRTTTVDSFYKGRRGAISVSGNRNKIKGCELIGFRDNIHISHSGTSQIEDEPEDNEVTGNIIRDVRGNIVISQTSSFGIYDFGSGTKILRNRVYAKSGDTYLLHGIKSEGIPNRRKDGTANDNGSLHGFNSVVGQFAHTYYLEGINRPVSAFNTSIGAGTTSIEVNCTDAIVLGNTLYSPDSAVNWDGTDMAAIKHSNGRGCRFISNTIVASTNNTGTGNGLVLITNGPKDWTLIDTVISNNSQYAYYADISGVSGTFAAAADTVRNADDLQALRVISVDLPSILLSQSQGDFSIGDTITQDGSGASATISTIDHTQGHWLRAVNINSGVVGGEISGGSIQDNLCDDGIYAFNVSDVSVDGLKVGECGNVGVRFLNAGSGNSIKNCSVEKSSSDGFNLANQTDLIFSDNKSNNCGGYGRKFSNCDLLELSSNHDVGSTSGEESRISGTTVKFRNSVSYNPPSLAAGAAAAEETMTVTGVKVGDALASSFSIDTLGIQIVARVSATDTVKWYMQNPSGNPNGTQDLGAGTVVIQAIRT